MWISRYFVYFVIFSVFGWMYETIFCTVRKGVWDNRGFLYGPICPIYGVGGALITGITDALEIYNVSYSYVDIFVVALVGSAILEFSTSWILEKLFHAYWWDYSHMPLNIQGRICLPCSCAFGFAGIFVIKIVAPFVKDCTNWISPLGFEFTGLFLMAFVACDTALTVSALTHFESNIQAAEEALNTHMDLWVNSVVEKRKSSDDAERERFSKIALEKMLGTMSYSTKSALKRVEGFRLTKPGQAKGRRLHSSVENLNSALSMIKDKVKGKVEEERK